jgi:hypothetical protein
MRLCKVQPSEQMPLHRTCCTGSLIPRSATRWPAPHRMRRTFELSRKNSWDHDCHYVHASEMEQGEGRPVQRLQHGQRQYGRGQALNRPANYPGYSSQAGRSTRSEPVQERRAYEKKYKHFCSYRFGPQNTSLMIHGFNPALLHRMTANASCTAWLPNTNAETMMALRKLAIRRSPGAPAGS